MNVAFTRSEVVLSTDPERMKRPAQTTRIPVRGGDPILPAVTTRPQSDWHRVFAEDRE